MCSYGLWLANDQVYLTDKPVIVTQYRQYRQVSTKQTIPNIVCNDSFSHLSSHTISLQIDTSVLRWDWHNVLSFIYFFSRLAVPIPQYLKNQNMGHVYLQIYIVSPYVPEYFNRKKVTRISSSLLFVHA